MFTAIVPGLYNLENEQLEDVETELWAFNKKYWKNLGEHLGLSEVVLEQVNADYEGEGVEKCFQEMIKQWLRRKDDDTNSKQPTWGVLAKAKEKTGKSCTHLVVSFCYPYSSVQYL